MRPYNVVGYGLLLIHLLISVLLAPPRLGPLGGVAVGFSYLFFAWIATGLYVSHIMHRGVAHHSLDFRPWFIGSVVIGYNLTIIYVDPVTYVNRHRHHHAFADRDGDPNKQADDGFWRTLYRCVMPASCTPNLARDPILGTLPFRIASNAIFGWLAQVTSYALLWLLVRNWLFALALWLNARLLAMWGNMLLNYWTHDRRYGTRRYDDDDNDTVNITDWLPLIATWGETLHNNHHHCPNLSRLSHHESEIDLGFLIARAMKAMGIVTTSPTGARLPNDIPLTQIGF